MIKYADKLRRRLIISSIMFISAIFFILTILSLYVYEMSYKRSIGDFKKLTENAFNHVMHSDAFEYKRIANIITNDEYVKQALYEKNRTKLYKHLKVEWNILHTQNPYLTIMLFVLPNNRAFLRMHKPDIYGDNLTLVRPMIQEVNKNHKILFGYETGKYSTVYRIVTPIFRHGRYIGALDLGINPVFIIDKMKEITGYHGFLFIKKNALHLFNRNSNIVIDNFVLQKYPSNNYNSTVKLFNNIDNKKELLQNGYIFFNNNKEYLTHILNIKNYKGTVDAKLLFFQDITDLYYSRLYFIYALISFAFLGLFIIILFINKQLKGLEVELLRTNKLHVKYIEKRKEKTSRFSRYV